MTHSVASSASSLIQHTKVIAVFDFDGTLARHDSLWPFLVAVAGLPRCVMAFACGFVFALGAKDRRGAVKAYVLQRLLGGRSVESLHPAIERMRTWPVWLPTAQALRDHHAKGHHILIATGGLSLYARAMFGDLPYDGLLATEMEVRDGVLTGAMAGGNCVRALKAQRVAAYLQEHGPFDDSWGYGNAPHDIAMLAHLAHRILV